MPKTTDYHLKESDIVRQISDLLTLRRVFFYRQNSGAMKAVHNGKSRFFRFGSVGAPDFVLVIRGKYIGIECKTKYGEQSQAQRDFEFRLKRAGGEYYVCRSMSDVQEVLDATSRYNR